LFEIGFMGMNSELLKLYAFLEGEDRANIVDGSQERNTDLDRIASTFP
jgi:hypothetical protein